MTPNAITAFRLGNFKAFGDIQRIPLRPLTLIYGANSAGKSSIIHSLLLARHGFDTGELDVYRTKIGGEAVDLGGFGQYVYQRKRNNVVEWAVELDPKQLQLGRLSKLLESVQNLTVGITIGLGFSGFASEVDGNNQVRVESFSLEADGQKLLNMSFCDDHKLRLNSLDYTHPLIKQVIPESQPLIEAVINELAPTITTQVFRLFPESIQVNGKQLGTYEEDDKQELVQIGFWLLRLLQDLISPITESVEREIQRLRYLGSFRSFPPRYFGLLPSQDTSWDNGGVDAWNTLLINHQVRQKVNAWLGDAKKMKTSYQLLVQDLIGSDGINAEHGKLINKSLNENLLSEIQKMVSNLTDTDTLIDTWTHSIVENSSERLPNLVLMDTRNQTYVSHRDVGIGVRQVIPILVYAYGSSNALVAIEQPETNLHPKLQAELGDVFIESALGENKNNFIIETHSENLLLRIMRRMRQTFNNELPEGLLPVTPEDVSVLYIEPIGNQSVVREMPLNECGELVEAWPGGFFEEGLEEVFS
ncbi:hypothetical protein NIES4071_81820 [Calothrix sp. NIES-4071]|nr:hypothetical protein NIES4071_81820 [Calothrix sp. NIES-4071]BAZ62451.1 hypothetical protein NIES4105_81750 [Calothrix sp. NIES-4105]